MNLFYFDILSRIPEPPKWFDEHAVPRWAEFSPQECANIYAKEVTLLEIKCQNCSRKFQVCISADAYQKNSLESEILDKSIGYGDPPNIECCAAGPTMTADTIKVIQFWKRVDHEWVRAESLEIKIDSED